MYVCVEVLMFLGVRVHLYMGCVAARVWRIEYRVCSAVCTVWWSLWVILRPGTSAVQLSPVQKKKTGGGGADNNPD